MVPQPGLLYRRAVSGQREEHLSAENKHLEVKRTRHPLAVESASVILKFMCKCGLSHSPQPCVVSCAMNAPGQAVEKGGNLLLQHVVGNRFWHPLPPSLDVFTLLVSSSLCF